MQRLAIGADGFAGEQIGIPPRVVDDHRVSGVPVGDRPMPPAARAMHWATVQVSAGNRDAASDLVLDRQKIGRLVKPRSDAVVGQGLDLGRGLRGVAEPLHRRQVLIIPVGPMKGAGLQGFQQHRATGREAGAVPLPQLRRIPLAVIGHAGQWIGGSSRHRLGSIAATI